MRLHGRDFSKVIIALKLDCARSTLKKNLYCCCFDMLTSELYNSLCYPLHQRFVGCNWRSRGESLSVRDRGVVCFKGPSQCLGAETRMHSTNSRANLPSRIPLASILKRSMLACGQAMMSLLTSA